MKQILLCAIVVLNRKSVDFLYNPHEISYNNKKVVKNTWNKKMNDLEFSEQKSDEEYDSDSSKDSFYYVTDSD